MAESASNRLAGEISPYLQQHASNPVDWYPWGEEAFARARADDKPVLLSVGYSACHWCHVMEHESFRDPETAALMNRLFVNVKVDREERPDIDRLYMQAVVAFSGRGGWPMTVFLTPRGAPFFGATYFPPAPRHGLPAFGSVLRAAAEAYRSRRGDVEALGREFLDALTKERTDRPEATEGEDTIGSALETLVAEADPASGGLGGAPKFPQPWVWEFMLRAGLRRGHTEAARTVLRTLDAMAAGGLYDHLGGGFHRYAVDARWRIPHFEKMLYDNAQLASLYVHAWQASGREAYRQVAVETLEYLLRDMAHPDGGFFASQDADSEGEEGRYYLWTDGEVRSVLGSGPDAGAVIRAWGIDGPADVGQGHVLRRETAVDGAILTRARQRLLDVRQRRVPPRRDEKVLTAWNAMTAAALAEAGRAFRRPDFLAAAIRTADFAARNLVRDGRLHRVWRDGRLGQAQGFLEDYAQLGFARMALHQATLDPRWLAASVELAERSLVLFRDADGAFREDLGEDSLLPAPSPAPHDEAVPCGRSTLCDWLLRLAPLANRPDFADAAIRALGEVRSAARRHPEAAARYLCCFAFLDAEPLEGALVCPRDLSPTDLEPWIEAWASTYEPNGLLAAARHGEADPRHPLFRGRTSREGCVTAYVCRGGTCLEPVTDVATFLAYVSRMGMRT